MKKNKNDPCWKNYIQLGTKKKDGKEVPNCVPMKEETDTSEKNEMAENQLYFIAYAAEEILDFIEEGGEVEEWYQNKLSKVHSDMESLHSYVEGEMYRTGMKEEVKLDEEFKKGDSVKVKNARRYDALAKPVVSGTVMGLMKHARGTAVMVRVGTGQMNVDPKDLVKEGVKLGEALDKDADAGDYIRDFRKSDAPQFKGKSKEKRGQMAIAAYMAAKKKMDEAKLDKVQPSELKKKFADRKDKDINNDGKVDSSDEYLHKRRQAIAKNVKEETITENVKKVASKLSSSKDPSVKKLVTLMNSGKEPSVKEVMSLKGAAQDSVIQAFAEVIGPEATMKKFGIKEGRKIALHSFMNFIEEKRNFSENKSDYELYHKDFSTAVQHASKVAEKRGYKIDTDDWDRKVAMGPRKPSEGKTNSYSINLMDKLGKQSRKKLQMQVYNKGGSKPFELNMYIQ
jgi:hypothetical protein